MREPARKLKRSAVKNIVRVSAAKSESGRPILVESILEKKYTLHLDFDANVVRYHPQPKTFELIFDDGSTHTYTPDFEVLFLDGSTSYVEVKPAKYAADLYFAELFRHMKTKVALMNIGFLHVDETYILQEPLLRNLSKLRRYKRRPAFNMQNLISCSQILTAPLALGDLIRLLKDKASLNEIYTWIALAYLQFDINGEDLNIETELTLHVY